MTHESRREAEVSRLVRDNRRLVEFAVNRYLRRNRAVGVEREDLVSWGLIGLLDAARAWDPSRGLAFSTLAIPAIERRIVRGLRSQRRGDDPDATLSLDQLLSEDGTGEGARRERHVDQLRDDRASVEEQIVRLELRLMVRQAIAELSPEQQWLLRRRFVDEQTLREIAAEVGTSRQAIHLREQNILRALRRKLASRAA